VRRRVPAAVVLAALLLTTAAPSAVAECMDWPIGTTERLDVAYAFSAMVMEASRDVDPPKPDNADFDWHVELAIDRSYRGDVPERLVYNGWDVGCHELRGDGLRTGDRIFVATERLDISHLPGDPFDGDVVVWKRTGDGWALHADALRYRSDEEFYPKAARTATTTAEILRLVSAASVPDTSTLSAPAERGVGAVIPALALAVMAGFVLALHRASRVRPT
jgi:hypothetical protein